MKTQCLADANRDHIALDALTVSNSRVEAACDDVGQRPIDRDFKLDLRIGRKEGRQHWSDKESGGGRRHGETQEAGWSVAERVDFLDRGRDLAEQRTQSGQQTLSRLSRRDAARGAIEQANTELLLQRPQIVAERWT